jgi:TetR/AcrR family transcriptional regulator
MRNSRGNSSDATGRREQNKLDKLRRIKEAARHLFTRNGFDRATTRAIARRAGVSLGTLFNYAGDKRDLVFLIFIEELDRVADRAFAAVNPGAPLLDQLTAAFAQYYRAFGSNTRLARILLQELTFYSSGKLAADFQRSRRRTIGFIETLVARAQQAGLARAGIHAEKAARSIFFIYAGAVRWWIASDTSHPGRGVRELRKLLDLHIAGLAPRAARPGRRAH